MLVVRWQMVNGFLTSPWRLAPSGMNTLIREATVGGKHVACPDGAPNDNVQRSFREDFSILSALFRRRTKMTRRASRRCDAPPMVTRRVSKHCVSLAQAMRHISVRSDVPPKDRCTRASAARVAETFSARTSLCRGVTCARQVSEVVGNREETRDQASHEASRSADGCRRATAISDGTRSDHSQVARVLGASRGAQSPVGRRGREFCRDGGGRCGSWDNQVHAGLISLPRFCHDKGNRGPISSDHRDPSG